MAQTLTITGGVRLQGAAEVPAAKNSVLPLLAASVLCGTEVRLRNVPALSDVEQCLSLLRGLGLAAQRRGRTVTVEPGPLQTCALAPGPAGAMRASVLFWAPVLARAGRVESGMPGGCRLGPRPVDIHMDGLVHLGAAVKWKTDRLILEAPHGLHGADYTLRFPSVGATETLLLAAAGAHGATVLRGAACEPEIADLAAFLNACGACITGAGSPVICISGVRELSGAAFTPLPDRIAAATLACACAAAGGGVTLRRCDAAAFAPVLEALRRAGCGVEVPAGDTVRVSREGRLSGIGRVFTGVYPAFPTDAAPLLAAALLGAAGESSIEDTVFENRFSCAAGFAAMGADVRAEGRGLRIRPSAGLHGAEVEAPDLRGGAALALAALAAEGTTVIRRAEYIRRGYEDLGGLLGLLGARAAQKSESESAISPCIRRKKMIGL